MRVKTQQEEWETQAAAAEERVRVAEAAARQAHEEAREALAERDQQVEALLAAVGAAAVWTGDEVCGAAGGGPAAGAT